MARSLSTFGFLQNGVPPTQTFFSRFSRPWKLGSVEEFKEFQSFDNALKGAQTADKEIPVKSHGVCQDPRPVGPKT